jgi:glycosyltransferase involved in cell wall biosynthesis
MKKLKVVHILYSFEVGGIESLVLQFCNIMNKEEYEFHIITLTNEDLQMVNLLPSQIKVHSLNLKKNEIKSALGLFRGFKELVNLFTLISPDIVHIHLTSLPLLFIVVAMKFSKIKAKNIRTVHTAGLFYENQDTLSDKIKLFAEKVAMKLVKINLVGVSNTVDENNRRLFKNIANDIKLITNGIDLKKYDKQQYLNIKKENFGVSDDCILISYVARLSYEKNHELLIDIWNEVIEKVPNAVLVIAGDGELRNVLQKKVIENKLENNIVFLGLINNVPELLSVTDIGVFPFFIRGIWIGAH